MHVRGWHLLTAAVAGCLVGTLCSKIILHDCLHIATPKHLKQQSMAGAALASRPILSESTYLCCLLNIIQ